MNNLRWIRLVVTVAALVMSLGGCETIEPARVTPIYIDRSPPLPQPPVPRPQPAPPTEIMVGAPTPPRHIPIDAKTDTTGLSRNVPITRPEAPADDPATARGEGRTKLDRERPTSGSSPSTPSSTRAARAIREAQRR